MRRGTALVHPSTVEREDVLALFDDPAFTFRSTVGHLLPEDALDALLDGDVAVVRDAGATAGLVGVAQMAEDHAGHYRVDVRLRLPYQDERLVEVVGAAVAHARSCHDVVRLTAVVPEHDLQTAAAYLAHGFRDEGVLRDVVACGRGRTGMRYLALVDVEAGED